MNSSRRCSRSDDGFGRAGVVYHHRAATRADMFHHRTHDPHDQPALGRVADIAAAAELVRKASDNGEAQSAMAVAGARWVQADKRLASVVQTLGRDAFAVIAHRDDPLAAALGRADIDGRAALV